MIIFDKDLVTNKNLWIFNNNILKFYDDSIEDSKYAEIIHTNFTARLYPDPNGIFTINLKDYLKALAIKNNLADVISFKIENTVESLVYDDTDNIYYELDLQIKVTKINEQTQEVNKNYKFISGVEQLEDYQKQQHHQTNLLMLQRTNYRSKHHYEINYWSGYPFDISILTKTFGDLNIKNELSGLDVNIPIPENNIVNRIVFCDGDTNITLENFLPLITGKNILTITRPGYDAQVDVNEKPITLIVNKHKTNCGIYIKFRSEAGGWTYWLLNKNHSRKRNTSSSKDIENDYSNIEDTQSPILQTGKSKSNDVLKGYAIRLTPENASRLEYIIDSPKIYLFTGERFSINNIGVVNQWMEIKCITSNIEIKKTKKYKNTLSLEFALPQRNMVSLL